MPQRLLDVFKEARRCVGLFLEFLYTLIKKVTENTTNAAQAVMLEIANVQAVFLDHSYCKAASLNIEFSSISKDELIKMADDMLDWKDTIGIEFDPPNATLSALSPSHSVDSGFDNEMNFLTDLDNLDLEMLLGADMNANHSNKKQKTSKSKASKCVSAPSTAATKQATEMSEVEKSKKNALAARENRLKKKKYLEEVEKELGELRRENEILKAKDRRHNQVVEKLEQEVSYLKSVLANQSTLSALMNRLVSTPGINFNLSSTDNLSTENPTSDDNDVKNPDVCTDDANDDDSHKPEKQPPEGKVNRFVQPRYPTRGTKRNASTESVTTERKKTRQDVKGGVCLHIGQDMVSLTFCSQCSRNISDGK